MPEPNHCPLFILADTDCFQPQFFCFLCQERHIGIVESAYQQFSTGHQPLYVLIHVSEQNVSVDVSQNDIKRSHILQDRGVSLPHADMVHVVQCNVLQRVAYTPFVNVDGRTGSNVPHPMSSTCLPVRSVSSSSLIISPVVWWCPVPKAICGLMTMS